LRDIFREWLLVNYPDKLNHTLSLVQSMHGGKDYDAQWGKRMAGSGPYAWMIGRRFEIAAMRLGYNERRHGCVAICSTSRRARRKDPSSLF